MSGGNEIRDDATLRVLAEALNGVVARELAEVALREAIEAFGATPGPYRIEKFVRGPLRRALFPRVGAHHTLATIAHVEQFADAVLGNGARRPLYEPPGSRGSAGG